MITDLSIVEEFLATDFNKQLAVIIHEYQGRGLTVEIQYGGENKNGHYSALVIGRK